MTLLAAFAALLGGTSGQDLRAARLAHRRTHATRARGGHRVLRGHAHPAHRPRRRPELPRARRPSPRARARCVRPPGDGRSSRLVEAFAPTRSSARDPRRAGASSSSWATRAAACGSRPAPPPSIWLQPVAPRRRLPRPAGVRRRPVRATTAERIAERFTGLVAAAVADPDGSVRASRSSRRPSARSSRRGTPPRYRSTAMRPHARRRPRRPPPQRSPSRPAQNCSSTASSTGGPSASPGGCALGAGRDVPIAVAVGVAGARRSPCWRCSRPVRRTSRSTRPRRRRAALILDELRAPVLLTTGRRGERLAARARCCSPDAAPATRRRAAGRAGRARRRRLRHPHERLQRPAQGRAGRRRGLANLAAWHVDRSAWSAPDRATLLAAPSFDASVWKLWPALVAGASVHVVDDPSGPAAERAPARGSPSRASREAFLPTPLAEAVLDDPWPRSGAAHAAHRRRRPAPRPGASAAVRASSTTTGRRGDRRRRPPRASPSRRRSPPPIGRPIANTRAHVVNRRQQELPVGATGELVLAGAGPGARYLGDAALTATVHPSTAASTATACGDRVATRRTGSSATLAARPPGQAARARIGWGRSRPRWARVQRAHHLHGFRARIRRGAARRLCRRPRRAAHAAPTRRTQLLPADRAGRVRTARHAAASRGTGSSTARGC